MRKTYEVTTTRELSDKELGSFLQGIDLEDGVAVGHNVKRFADMKHSFLISVFEGRNRLIRRMVEFHNADVTKLKRIEYAGLSLKGVSNGRWRFLKQTEINDLRKLVKLDALDLDNMAFDNISVSSGIIDSTEGNPIRWDLYTPISGTRRIHPVILFIHGFKGFKDWGAFPDACEELALWIRSGSLICRSMVLVKTNTNLNDWIYLHVRPSLKI